MNPFVPFAGLILSSLVWGLSWWPIRWLDAHGLHVLWATAAMYLVPTVGLFLIGRRAVAPWLGRRTFWLLVAAAGLTNVAFNWGVLVGEVIGADSVVPGTHDSHAPQGSWGEQVTHES